MKRILRLKGKMDAGKMYQAGLDFQDKGDVLDLTIRAKNRRTGRIDTLVIKMPPSPKLPKAVHLIAVGSKAPPMPHQMYSVGGRPSPGRRSPRRPTGRGLRS